MNTKIIKLDLNRILYDKIIAKQGDTKSRFLLFQLLDGSIAFNLTNRSVRAYMVKPDGKEIFNDLIINNYSLGYCTLELTNQVLAVPGTVKIELMVTEEDRKLTSSVFELEVIKSINSEKSIVSTNEFTALLNGLSSLSEYDNYKNEIAAARDGEVNLLTKVKKIDEQLDTIDNNVNDRGLNIKEFGAIGDDKLHPLSEFFTSLEEAKTVYPNATSLADSIDSVAIQKAIDYYDIMIHSGGTPKDGGIVHIPAGNYRLNKTINMKKGIHLQGVGTGGTWLSWSGLNITAIEYIDDAESSSIKDMTLLDVANGIIINTSNYCNFERLALYNCFNYGIEIRNGVCNTFNGLKIVASRYGIYFNNQRGSTTQYFKDIHISRCTHTGFRIQGNEFGISQCILENVICEYCELYGIYMSADTWHTRSNIFKRIWLEGNKDYGFYYKSGDYGTLDEIYADPGTKQTVFIEGGESIVIKNVQGNLTVTNDKTVYIDGYVTGTEVYNNPDKIIRFSKDNYKKYTSTTTGAILVNAYRHITGKKDKANGVFMVTVKDNEVGVSDFKVAIYNFKEGEYCTKTELAGTMGVVENESGTIANASGRSVTITVDLMSHK